MADSIYNCTVSEVIDGDTVVLSVDLGLHWLSGLKMAATRTHVRIAGINAPEKNTPEGLKSKAWAEVWLQQQPVIQLRVHSTPTEDVETEKYGRVFGDIITPTGLSFAQAAIDAGVAKKWDGHGPRPV